MKLFLTGTDTEVGKTVVACSLLRALHSRNVPALGMKPVSAGVNARGAWDDVERLRAASALSAALEDVAPYRLRAPASPHFAAGEEGVTILKEVILSALGRLERLAEFVVIEGVGGFRVPLSDRLDSAQLAQAIGAPVLIVVPMRLGCINQALLTAEAVASRGLPLAGWAANAGIDPGYGRTDATVETLNERMPAPCIGVLPRLDPGKGGAEYLNIDRVLMRSRSKSTPVRRCS